MIVKRHKQHFIPAILIIIASTIGEPRGINMKERNVKEKRYEYAVKKTASGPVINSNWKKENWKQVKSITLRNYMGEKPSHFPLTNAKMCYDDKNIYLIFRVRDKYVIATEKNMNGKVWFDSCVEFFFSPGPDTQRGYFNFETNCKGVYLFQYHTDNGNNNGSVSEEDRKLIAMSYSLKRDTEKEITDNQEWIVEYSIPVKVLKKYMKVEDPGPGVKWRANFYKCADKSSHPHWLTWAQVDHPKPKFHLPEFFGWLKFE